MANKIERLTFTRKRLVQDIERQVQKINECQADTEPIVLLSRKDALEELWSDFRANTKEFETSQNWAGSDQFIEENGKVHELYLKGVAQITKLLPAETNALQQSFTLFRRNSRNIESTNSEPNAGNEPTIENPLHDQGNAGLHSSTPTSTTVPRMGGLQAAIKLPPLQIKTFTGNLLDWPEFKATCKSICTDEMSDTNKFRYLKSFVTDEPAHMIKHLPLCNGSYDRAWSILEKRYDNERAIINTNLKRVFDLQTSTFESAETLKTMLNVSNECIATVNSYGINTDSWDAIMIFTLTRHLDAQNIQHWEEQIRGKKTIPKLSEFTEFLEMRISILETTAASKSMMDNSTSTRKPKVLVATTSKKCTICGDNHFAFKCPQLNNIPSERRIQFIIEKGLCVNCLYGHNVEDCKSKYSCRHCNERHNSVLHPPAQIHNLTITEELDIDELQAIEMNNEFVGHVNEVSMSGDVKLATALVRIEYGSQYVYARALIDQGATANLITKRLAEILKLPQKNVGVPIMGVCDTISYNVKKKTTFLLRSNKDTAYALKVSALVVPKITTVSDSRDKIEWTHLQNLELADPKWKRGGRIDILLGSAVHAEIILEGLIKGKTGQPIAQKTELGWVISGGNGKPNQASIFTLKISNEDLSQMLLRFWESEELPRKKMYTPDEQKAEETFIKTTKRCSDGRIMVELPFINENPSFGESKLIAMKRYMGMSKRLSARPEFKTIYDASIKEYLDLDQMELADEDVWPHNYLPHHPVIKESSTTTKVRAVYDASCKTSNGNSLNSQLLVGPTIQSDLFSILIHWRKRKYAITGDIEKMYRQIWLAPKHTEFQRILWQAPGTSEIKSYRLKTVTFGVASAPFLAIRTLFLIADDIESDEPEMADKIRYQFYVDDFFDSVDTIDEAKQTIANISSILAKYGFILRKWKSNCQETLSEIKDDERDSSPSNVFKTLGIQWQPTTDTFLFVPAELKEYEKWTKRTILSDISRMFDPLGWYGPCLILAKIFMQKLWLLQVGWDDELSVDITTEWLTIREQFTTPCSVKIPRWIGITSDTEHISLQGFCDASEQAMAGTVYLRVQYSTDDISCNLVAAKTKVAPLKKVSIPRLELNGAVLLASLMEKVREALKLPDIRQQAWSDSQITLHWIASHPSRWKTYIANRVAEVQKLMPSHLWKHIDSTQNPADCASRGLTREELEGFKLWWHGPDFLCKPETDWPKIIPEKLSTSQEVEAKQHFVVATVKVVETNPIIERFSSLDKLARFTVYCLRWQSLKKREIKAITIDEIEQAEMHLVKLVQRGAFNDEIHRLQGKQSISQKSSIHNLDPYIDSNGILRVGGRIQRAAKTDGEKHPIILPPKNHLTTLLIRQAHDQTLHGGYGLVARKLRQRYWIVTGSNAIKSELYKCVICFRFKKKLLVQKMGDLPSYRLQEAIPFTYAGVDYAGYFEIKSSARKNAPYIKGYVALFICLTTRAVHLEVVSDLSTIQFLKAFKRFIGRRGIPKHMFSDNATNFIGADGDIQLALDQALAQNNSDINKFLLKNKITWSTIPARAPHFGGWECGVKLMKHHLKRILGNVRLTFEDFNTLIIEVEAIVNSRPLWAVPTHPSEHEALTPGHFLISKPLNVLPEPNISHIPINRLSQYQFLQRLRGEFWKIWSHEYIQTLQTRKKWKNTQPNVRPGQIVLVSEDNEPPACWSLGQILEVYPGEDGLVRAVDVRCRSKTLRRPIHKLSLLPIVDNGREDITKFNS